MPRTARIAPGGIIFHVLNRGVSRSKSFRTRKDYEAFQRCLLEAQEKVPMRVLALDRLGESAAVRAGRGRHPAKH
jgi:hypothetical protein